MTNKPKSASGYSNDQVSLVHQTCLYVATKLGDMTEDLLIVGGLVPSLLVDQTKLPEDVPAHAGTMDLDLGLQLALLDEGRYRKLTERLRDAGFTMDVNEEGNRTRQRWTISKSDGAKATIDFLIPPSREKDRGGTLRDIERDFAAIIAPGLACGFEDRVRVELDGLTLQGEKAKREVWVCGAGAFIVLKALAFHNRGENKDAYDLHYILSNYGTGEDSVFERLEPLLARNETQQALDILERDFLDPDGVGPRRVAQFVTGGPDDEIQADVVGYVTRLLHRCRKT